MMVIIIDDKNDTGCGDDTELREGKLKHVFFDLEPAQP